MEKKKKTALLAAGGLLVLVLIAAVAVLTAMLVGRKGPGEAAEESGGYVMQEENYQQILEDMQNEVEEGYFETHMNTEWTFPDGASETQDAILGNSPNNTKPIRCEVVLAGTEEVVFKTGVLPVGRQLAPFKLDVDLDAGTYEAVCMVYLLEETGGGKYRDYSSAGFNVTIKVEK